jgi:hypothetical protein
MELELLLAQSAATDAFKADVRAFSVQAPAPRIATARHSPRVKVLRVIAQLAASEPRLAVERIHVDAHSGCSDFVGTITVSAGGTEYAFRFAWCCQWRATEEGWTDCFGFPDQMRAAREFGWRCFERWEPIAPPALLGTDATRAVAVS